MRVLHDRKNCFHDNHNKDVCFPRQQRKKNSGSNIYSNKECLIILWNNKLEI